LPAPGTASLLPAACQMQVRSRQIAHSVLLRLETRGINVQNQEASGELTSCLSGSPQTNRLYLNKASGSLTPIPNQCPPITASEESGDRCTQPKPSHVRHMTRQMTRSQMSSCGGGDNALGACTGCYHSTATCPRSTQDSNHAMRACRPRCLLSSHRGNARYPTNHAELHQLGRPSSTSCTQNSILHNSAHSVLVSTHNMTRESEREAPNLVAAAQLAAQVIP
jgi:hypothetical protein